MSTPMPPEEPGVGQHEAAAHKGSHPLCYAGVGSRETPADVLALMGALGQVLASAGYVLRSGASRGADAAFEAGAVAAGGYCEIFLPWPGFNGHSSSLDAPSAEAHALAATVHQGWTRRARRARLLLARNAYQCLGSRLDDPVDFVVCWTPDGAETEAARGRTTGGTSTVIVLANRRGIPVFNLHKADALERLAAHLARSGVNLPNSLS